MSLEEVPSDGGGGVAPAELLAAAAVLRRLTPSDLTGPLAPEAAELKAAGMALFRRSVLHERFGEADAVAHFKQAASYKGMLAKLERLEQEIRAEHDKRVSAAAACGINRKREERMKGIEAAAKVTHSERLALAAAAGDSGGPLLLTGAAADDGDCLESVKTDGVVAADTAAAAEEEETPVSADECAGCRRSESLR